VAFHVTLDTLQAISRALVLTTKINSQK